MGNLSPTPCSFFTPFLHLFDFITSVLLSTSIIFWSTVFLIKSSHQCVLLAYKTLVIVVIKPFHNIMVSMEIVYNLKVEIGMKQNWARLVIKPYIQRDQRSSNEMVLLLTWSLFAVETSKHVFLRSGAVWSLKDKHSVLRGIRPWCQKMHSLPDDQNPQNTLKAWCRWYKKVVQTI